MIANNLNANSRSTFCYEADEEKDNQLREELTELSKEGARAPLEKRKRVTILAGAGCNGARTELLQLAEPLQAPIVHALRGKEFVEYENTYNVGMTGLLLI